MGENKEIIELNGEMYEVLAHTASAIRLADSFVVGSNRIGMGHGERRLHISADLIKSKFFNCSEASINCITLKTDLLAYLEDAKNEYMHPSQEYRKKEELPNLWQSRYDEIEMGDDIVFFTAQLVNHLNGMAYISLNDSKIGKNAIRHIALSNCGSIDITKVQRNGEISYYWKPIFAL